MWLPVTLSGGSLEPAGDGRTRQMIIHDITRLTVLLAAKKDEIKKKMMKRIILASQSPRRKELLEQVGLKFEILPAGGEERITTKDPALAVRELAAQKAAKVLGRAKGDCLIIGADTVVALDGQILGKPADEEDAARMLRMLQGRSHSVYTGVALLHREGDCVTEAVFSEETRVAFYPMTEGEIRGYIKSKEPMDKAGAYGIQGLAAAFVEKISGDYNNVVGLPVGRIWQELKKRGWFCDQTL